MLANNRCLSAAALCSNVVAKYRVSKTQRVPVIKIKKSGKKTKVYKLLLLVQLMLGQVQKQTNFQHYVSRNCYRQTELAARIGIGENIESKLYGQDGCLVMTAINA